MKIERTKNTIRNLSWGYIYRGVAIILPFVFRTVMLKRMGADYLGMNSLFSSVLQIVNLSELGFGTAMVYSMYKPIAENDKEQICALLRFYKKIYFVIGCAVMGIGLIILPFIPHLIFGEYPNNINIYFVYCMFLGNSAISYFLFAYRGSLLNAFQRNDIESKILIGISIVRYTTEIVGIWVTREYYLFLIIELFTTVFTNIIKYIWTKKIYPEFIPKGNISIELKKDIKKNALALMCHKVGYLILNSVDNIVLSVFMGVAIVANYTNYYYILNAVESMVIICFTGMTAGVGNSFITETVERNKDNFKKILFFNAWVVGWCSVCLLCLYQDFMELWVGNDYKFSNNIIMLMVVYFFVHNIRRTIITFRDGAGAWQDNKWQPIVSAIFNLIVNIVLVNIMGVAGVVISSIASMILIDIPWESFKFCNKMGIDTWWYIWSLVKYFIITTIVASGMYWAFSYICFDLVLNLLVKAVICGIVPNIVFLLCYHRKEECIFYKNLIIGYIKKIKEITVQHSVRD